MAGENLNTHRLTKDTVMQITEQEVRVAANLQGNQEYLDREAYNVEQAREQKRLIDQIFQNREALEISNEQEYKLQIMQGRNISHILLNNQKFMGDSEQMQAVKEDVENLERLLNVEAKEMTVEEMIFKLEIAYQLAIASCQRYCNVKNPTFKTGIERKSMVQETLEHLKQEAGILQSLKENGEQGQLQGNVEHIRDLLILGQQYQQTVETSGINGLNYEDFASMIGTYNRGQIEYAPGGLKIINNGYFSSSTGTESKDNLKMRQRFYAVAIQKLGEQATPQMHLRLRKSLGLEEQSETAKPLSRTVIKEVITEVNEMASIVTRALKEGSSSTPQEKRVALTVAEMLGGGMDAYDRYHTRSNQEEMLRNEINSILEAARKYDESIPYLNKHQMDSMVKGNVSLLRDEIFKAINHTCNAMSNLSRGQNTDFNQICENREAISRMAAYTVIKMTAENEMAKAIADMKLKKCVMDTAFNLAGKEGLQSEYNDTYVGDLAYRGSLGLVETMDERMPDIREWHEDQEKTQRGKEDLVCLCDRMQELSILQGKAFDEGLQQKEAERVLELGQEIQNLIQSRESMTAMEFVVKGLQGTRFAQGLNRVKALQEREFSFVASTEKIAQLLQVVENKKKEEEQKAPNELETVEILEKETEEMLKRMEPKTQAVVRVLLLQKAPSSLLEDSGNRKSLVKLHKVLRNFPKAGVHIEEITIAGIPVCLIQREDMTMELVVDHITIPVYYSAELIADRMESDMVVNESLYGEKTVKELVFSLQTEQLEYAEVIRVRNLCLKLIESKTGISAAFFNNITLKKILDYTRNFFDMNESLEKLEEADREENREEKKETREEKYKRFIIRDVNMLENCGQINGEEALELTNKMQRMEAKEKARVKSIVSIQKKIEEEEKEEKKKPDHELKWEIKEEEVRDFIADMLFSEQTWVTDQKQQKPGERMQKMFIKHMPTLVNLFKEPELLKKVLDKLPLPKAEEGQEDVRESIYRTFLSVFEQDTLEKLPISINKDSNEKVIRWSLSIACAHPEAKKQFMELENRIDEAVQGSMQGLQDMVRRFAEDIYGKAGTQQEEGEISPVEKLQKILEEQANGEKGQGKFIKLVLTNYFAGVSLLDQRAMLASALRNAKPVPGKLEELDQKQQKKLMGNFLGGMLKGAGPLFQKMLQGMPAESLPEELKDALEDMKSNLSPISEEYVEKQMYGIIMRSKGKITHIDVRKPLGAASVGQTFLCKVYGPGISTKGKNVVVKILRPDVRNRMMREKDIMLRCARETDAGMEKTYQGQLKRIEEELDLSLEAKNVEKGKVYDKSYASVQAMKVDSSVEPTPNVMVLEKAQGETVDKYLKNVKKKIEDLLSPFYMEKSDGKIILDTGTGRKAIFADGKRMNYLAQNRKKMENLLVQLKKRQENMLKLAETWVKEGIYGEGFYHGDLHSGNIMVDDSKLTVIDFGNATKLSYEQQKHIMRMLAAAASGDVEMFRNGFHMLLEKESEQNYQQQRDRITNIVTEIFRIGSAPEAGLRIAACLVKIQELGIELPAAIQNFSQCQIRLQNSIEDMNATMKGIKQAMEDMDRCRFHVPQTDPISSFHIELSMDGEKTINPASFARKYKNKFGMVKTEFNTSLEGTTEEAKSRFGDQFMPQKSTIISGLEAMTNAREWIDGLKQAGLEFNHENLGTVDSYLTQCMGALAGFYDYHEMDELKEILENFNKDRVAQVYQCIEAFEKLCDTARNRYREMEETLSQLRGKQIDPHASTAEKEQLTERLYQLCDDYRKKCAKEDMSDFYVTLSNLDEINLLRVRSSVEPWFEDKTYGKQLKTEFDAYLEAVNTKAENISQKREEFLDTCQRFLHEYFSKLEEAMSMQKMDEPEGFFNVMGRVIENNKTSSVFRLGIWNSIKLYYST